MLAFRAILFTILIPGTVVGYLPSVLVRRWPSQLDFGLFRYGGLALIVMGLLSYFACVFVFITKGKGTPTTWFTKPIRFIVGEEPQRLVLNGLYQFTRNPMYISVVTVVLGEAIWFEKPVLFIYATVLWLFFHLFVIVIEEPHLKKRDSEGYEAYSRRVPRWIGFPKPGNL